MSGLCGILDLDKSPEPLALRGMLFAARHRGPDGLHEWCGQQAAFGHLAQALTPEERGAQQPLSDGELAISADARLDDRAQLVRELRHEGFSVSDSASDAFLILTSYRRWGLDCPCHLLGDFSFAIWDAARVRLIAARDPMGLRPFYYRPTRTGVLFASEVAQLLSLAGVPAILREDMVAAFLSGRPAPLDWTFYVGIEQLPPAHMLIVDPAGHRLQRYWDIDPHRRLRCADDAQYAHEFRELFKEAVRCRLRSIMPVGLMLSGGMDSGAIGATAGYLFEHERARIAAPDFRAYCWAFETVGQCDERHISELIAGHYAMPVRDIAAEEALESFPEHSLHRDEPSMLNYQALHDSTFSLARFDGVGLIMSGIRGDLLVGLDPDLLGLVTDRQLRRLWKALKAESRRRRHLPRTIVKRLLLPALITLWPSGRLMYLRRRLWGHVVDWRRSQPPPDWLEPAFARSLGEADQLLEAPPAIAASARRQRYEGIFSEIQVRVLVQMERNAARAGLSFADPWSDRRLSEFVLSIPQWRLHQWKEPKRLARAAMLGIMQEEARRRTVVSDFGPLYRHLLLAARPAILDLMSDSRAAMHGFIRPDRVRSLYEAACRGERSANGLWPTLSLEMWLRKYWD